MSKPRDESADADLITEDAVHLMNRIIQECGGADRLPRGQKTVEVTARIKKHAGYKAAIDEAETLITKSSDWKEVFIRVVTPGRAEAILSI